MDGYNWQLKLALNIRGTIPNETSSLYQIAEDMQQNQRMNIPIVHYKC